MSNSDLYVSRYMDPSDLMYNDLDDFGNNFDEGHKKCDCSCHNSTFNGIGDFFKFLRSLTKKEIKKLILTVAGTYALFTILGVILSLMLPLYSILIR